MPAPKLSRNHQRALTVLVGSPAGRTESIMLAHGFKPALLDDLVKAGLATTSTDRMIAGGKPLHVTRFKITDTGRRALQGA